MLRLLQKYGIFELRITGKESHYILNSLYIIVLISSMLNGSTRLVADPVTPIDKRTGYE